MPLELVKLGTSNFMCLLIHWSASACIPPKGMSSASRDLFKFWEISDTISEMVQENLYSAQIQVSSSRRRWCRWVGKMD